jgi:hypothetical protein
LHREYTHIRAGEQLKGTQHDWVEPMGLGACGECDRDGDDSSYRQASLTDAEEESHCSFPGPYVLVLPKPGHIFEQEHNA